MIFRASGRAPDTGHTKLTTAALFIIKRAIHLSPTMPTPCHDFPSFGKSIFNGRINFFVWVSGCHVICVDFCCQLTTIAQLLILVNIVPGNFEYICNLLWQKLWKP
jgi:hypothetical protein